LSLEELLVLCQGLEVAREGNPKNPFLVPKDFLKDVKPPKVCVALLS